MNRTMLAILKVLEKHPEKILGSREISRKLKLYGVELTERTVRYHLRILDERGLTKVFGKEGRMITQKGKEELSQALVSEKVGFVISKIETLSYLTDFDLEKNKGNIILNAGIPVISKFGGVLQVENSEPSRFTALISYEGSSLDPLEIFIKSRMTDVIGAKKDHNGKILASFREIPVVSIEKAKELSQAMKEKGIGGILFIGNPNQPLLEMPVAMDKAGMIIVGGLNPIAALEEAGITTVSKDMSTLYKFSELIKFK